MMDKASDHVIFGLLTIGFLGLLSVDVLDCISREDRERDAARATQVCDVQGQELGCVQNTAWYVDDTCSCALDGGRRISFDLERE